jgi:hypothetical protein
MDPASKEEIDFLINNYSAEELTKMSTAIYKGVIDMRNEGLINNESFGAISTSILKVWAELMAIQSSQKEEQ